MIINTKNYDYLKIFLLKKQKNKRETKYGENQKFKSKVPQKKNFDGNCYNYKYQNENREISNICGKLII